MTGAALLEECRGNFESLILENLETYTIKSIIKKPTYSSRDEYVITIDHEDRLNEHVFKIGFAIVENIIYIDKWELKNRPLSMGDDQNGEILKAEPQLTKSLLPSRRSS